LIDYFVKFYLRIGMLRSIPSAKWTAALISQNLICKLYSHALYTHSFTPSNQVCALVSIIFESQIILFCPSFSVKHELFCIHYFSYETSKSLKYLFNNKFILFHTIMYI